MTAAEEVPFKSYLIHTDGESWEPEIRKFSIHRNMVTSLAYLKEKLAIVYPKLSRKIFDVYWKDIEGDQIKIGSDEELLIALAEMEGDLKKIYVKAMRDEKSQAKGSCGLDVGVVCDGCDREITDMRSKCIVCPDFDLCDFCIGKGLHKEHGMIRYQNSGPSPFFNKKLWHELKTAKRMDFKNAKPCWSSYKHGMPQFGAPPPYSGTHSDSPRGAKPQQECPMGPVAPNLYKFIDGINTNLYPFLNPAGQGTSQGKEKEQGASQGNEKARGARLVTENIPKAKETAMETEEVRSTENQNGASTSEPTAEKESEKDWAFVNKEDKVEEALQQMLAMGFTNVDNKLRNMIMVADGDVSAVIELFQKHLK